MPTRRKHKENAFYLRFGLQYDQTTNFSTNLVVIETEGLALTSLGFQRRADRRSLARVTDNELLFLEKGKRKVAA